MNALNFSFNTYTGDDSGMAEASFLSEDNLFIVVEGVGGEYLGDIARERACKVIYHTFFKYLDKVRSPGDAMTAALKMANEDILRKRKEIGRKMAASVSVAFAKDGILYFAHLGDTRIYCLHKGEINQLTRDHTVREKESFIESGYKDPRILDALTDGLGFHEHPDIHVKKFALRVNDLILMTTEGLTKNVSDREISRICSKIKNLKRLSEELIKSARKSGNAVNFTVGLMRYERAPMDRKKKIMLGYGALILLLFFVMGGFAYMFRGGNIAVDGITMNRTTDKPVHPKPKERQKSEPLQKEKRMTPMPLVKETPSSEGMMVKKAAAVPTPGMIKPSEQLKKQEAVNPDPRPSEKEENVSGFIEDWKDAWEKSAGVNGDMVTYMSFYSRHFSTGGLDKAGWRTDKTLKNKGKKWIKIRLDHLEISKTGGDEITVQFDQDYRSSNFSGKSRKTLVLQKEQSGLKIIREMSNG